MGSARASAGRLYGFIQDVQRSGVTNALTRIGLGDYVGRPATEALAALTETICPKGGPLDESIARDAFVEAIINITADGVTNLESLSLEQWNVFFVEFVSQSIVDRIINDIGAKGISVPQDVEAARQLQQDVHDFVRGCVSDAFADRLSATESFAQAEVQQISDSIFATAFAYLEALGEE